MFSRCLAKIFIAFLGLFISYPITAATIDLTGVGGNGGGFGNSLQISSGVLNVNVTAYGETGSKSPSGSLYYLFEAAEIYSWATGIGSCNQQEGTRSSGCSNAEHEVDTVNRDDLIVFEFDQSVEFESLTIDPFNNSGPDANGRDIVYWIGNVASLADLTLETFNTLDLMTGFGPETQSTGSSGFSPFTHQLTGIGNILLLSGDYHELSCKDKSNSSSSCEAYKINSISASPATVPTPAAIWLMTTALFSLGFTRKHYSNC